ncbi:hypothetical protein AN958_12155 [Leucoagaricus sp. SymC.cos]|nr:hypothetical protein AN958_12155 [Leucoagaricus sp. SymC.cos]
MNNILSSVANITGANVPPQQSLALAERVDIHKSCKSLETLLNVLNDYCEAATAIVTLQKRLTKALRETAGSKVTNETASNALNASASIFEALAEVDAKFVKIADKEYDAISTEVKRWFRKLAKDEKAHDDRIVSANAKIKQAGLNFEKKSKKKAADAQDEHSRYIHLISTLGPEITQEKYNHSLQVTQRHATTICSVSACLARIADTEWIRSCESVRRFAPTVGPLGEWRSLCEGGWTKDIPGDLVDLDVKVVDNLKLNTIQERVELEEGPEEEKGFARQAQPPTPHIPTRYQRPDGDPSTPDFERTYPHQHLDTPRGERELTTSTSTSYPSQTQSSSSGNSLTLPQNPRNSTYSGTAANSPQATSAALPLSTSSPRQTSVSPAASPRVYQAEQDHNSPNALNNTLRAPSPISQRPRSNLRDGSPVNDDRDRFFSDPATGSVRSLSAFPAPPAHFPLPPPRTRDAPTPVSSRPSISAIKENKEEQTYTAEERLSESPLPLEHDQDRQRETNDMPPITQPQPRKQDNGVDRYQERRRSNAGLDVPQYSLSSTPPDHVMSSTKVPTRSARALAVLPPENNTDDSRGSRQPQENFRAREFGVLREESSGSASGRAHTFSGSVPTPSTAPIEFPSASVPSQRRGTQVEQTDTGTSTTGSIVAAMKSRYSNAVRSIHFFITVPLD